MMLAPKISGVGMDCVVQLLAPRDKAMIADIRNENKLEYSK
jgi:hypothetical protein